MEAAGGRALALPYGCSEGRQVEAASRCHRAGSFGPIDIWINDAMVTVFSPCSGNYTGRISSRDGGYLPRLRVWDHVGAQADGFTKSGDGGASGLRVSLSLVSRCSRPIAERKRPFEASRIRSGPSCCTLEKRRALDHGAYAGVEHAPVRLVHEPIAEAASTGPADFISPRSPRTRSTGPRITAGVKCG